MKKVGHGTFKWMKSINRTIVLNKIRKNAPISRAQIASETGLTPPTVSNIVKSLLEKEIIRETQLGESQGGRKPTLLMLNSNHLFVIGVDAGPGYIKCILTNLEGQTKKEYISPSVKGISEEQFLQEMKQGVAYLLHADIPKEKVIGIGVAMHGAVDAITGTSLFAPNLGFRNLQIKQHLEKEFDIEVKVDNDARAMAMGEYWFDEHGELETLVALNIGSGVGSGIILNGKLFYGAQSVAGEIGHMTIDLYGELCECGNVGCLQTLATGDAIARQAKKEMTLEMINQLKEPLSGETVYKLAKEGNEIAIKVLERTGTIIGIGIINLIHLLNPDRIVIGGGVSMASEFIMPSIKKSIQDRGLTQQVKDTEVVLAKLGSDSTVKGAIAIVLDSVFHPTNN
ncbi:ROK family transcriptional regulator [Sporosarcina saromensis]|uniref:ROK family transcriptional regulator n=1 Tax=Sporosarcina saromensis TaxID=359365 RepID=A0ABU4G7Y1_9BACL|nr:ROK family transcriptional regulator [Sporosarcina saromensis]MDW0113085.1 ROK family transcriptional regulator [Sporosarcina saromensis]